jgi:toxin FitB
MNYLLDTNVISELVAPEPQPQVLDWLDSLDPRTVYLSVITIGEIQKGIARLPASARRQQLHDWLVYQLPARFAGQILVLDTAVMLTWGVLVAELEQRGRPLPAIDSLIAATARHHHCTLVTRNEKDFADTGIALFTPW